MPSNDSDPALKWVPANTLKAGDVIVIRQEPPHLMPVTGVKIQGDLVLVENPLYGETRATPEMKIRIQTNANVTSP